MNNGLRNFLIYSSFVVVVPFIASVLRFRKLEKPLRLLAVLIFFDFSSEVIIHICFFLKINNQFLWPIFIVLEFGLLAWLYRYELRPMVISRIIPFLIPVFLVCTLIDWIHAKQSGLSAIPHFAEGVLVLYFVMCYYYKTLQAPVAIHLEKQPLFWLSTGLFIYFSVDSVIFIFSNYMQSFPKHFNNQIWFIHAIFNIVLYVFYTIAICLTPKKQI